MSEDLMDDSHSRKGKPGSPEFVQRLIGRSLSDIRIHTDDRAGTLAHRLGARAFTVGRDVYLGSGYQDASTPEGAAVLTHELTHVVEQTGGRPSEMPLLKPNVSVQRQEDESSGTSAPASQTASEASAQQAEQGARQSAQSGNVTPQSSTSAPSPPDADEVAERVYRIMCEHIVLERERGAHNW